MLRDTRTFRTKLPKEVHQEREQPRTIQKGRAKGYKSREAGEREQPRRIQKGSARGYKSREARKREQPRTTQKGRARA